MIRRFRNRLTSLSRGRALGRPRRGQATIMFALLAVPMIGMLGLAVDGGVYLYARRTAQAAADAAALAGARQLSKSTNAAPKPAQAEVTAIAGQNGQGSIAPTVLECRYIDQTGGFVSPGPSCGSSPPANASGVFVKTTVTVRTFFIPVLPGGPSSSTTTASAKALVQRSGGIPADAPFIVCGNTAKTTDGTLLPIVESISPFKLKQSSIGQTFVIHDSNLGEADCNAQGNSFKGLADQGENDGRDVPGWLRYDNGTKAGPTRAQVDGPDGCAPNTPPPYKCVMLLPLATDTPKPTKQPPEIYVYGFAAFEVTQKDSNTHLGKLLGPYIVSGPGGEGWTQGDGGVVTVRLAG
ncbi:MAG: pilus assembly protein [Thermomicrobiales bacterium]|nr:pilus assembly protein [Thermomicrobiales bacterium]